MAVPETQASALPASQLSAAWISALVDHWRGRQEWILQQQMALTRIAAPTGAESARAEFMMACFRERSGLAVHRDGHGNVCVRVSAAVSNAAAEGAQPTYAEPLVCLAHLDTVFAADTPLVMRRNGPVIHCPGIGDNGRGLAALLVLGHLFGTPEVRRRLERPVHLVATVGEEGEGNLRGVRGWLDDYAAAGTPAPHAVIAIDGPGDEAIVHRAIGALRLRLSFRGAGGHSWTDAQTANPVHAACQFVAGVASLTDPRHPEIREGGTTIAATRMAGGESLTSIPFDAWVDIDLRSVSSRSLERLRGTILRLAQHCLSEEMARHPRGTLSLETTVLGERPAGSIPELAPLVRAARAATEASGRVPQSCVASTDANLPLARGIPAIAIGAGGSGGAAHTAREWYDDTHGPVGIERLLRLVLSLTAA